MSDNYDEIDRCWESYGSSNVDFCGTYLHSPLYDEVFSKTESKLKQIAPESKADDESSGSFRRTVSMGGKLTQLISEYNKDIDEDTLVIFDLNEVIIYGNGKCDKDVLKIAKILKGKKTCISTQQFGGEKSLSFTNNVLSGLKLNFGKYWKDNIKDDSGLSSNNADKTGNIVYRNGAIICGFNETKGECLKWFLKLDDIKIVFA